jgi:two-component system response regulator AtoC
MAQELGGSSILIADDEPSIRQVLRDLLEDAGATVREAGSGLEALQAITSDEPDLAILDIRMPEPGGLALLQQLRAKGMDLPVLIITADDSSAVTIEAIQHGAYDYITKPLDLDEVLVVVQRAIEHRRLTRRVHALEQQVNLNPRDTMIGRSPAMQQVYKMIGRVASSDATVLITGESGTGKELVAQVLHRTSPRREAPFIAVNCAALPETLLESELFGHEKGAFTGALAQRKGLFEQAQKGTLFLDEIGDISHSTQKKLLRVLQERTLTRVGGNTPVKVDVRLITATNRDLLAEVASGAFRDDLYYRLNVINIHMPPLRERKDDIPLLVQHFLHKHRLRDGQTPRITDAAMELLLDYDWPGNVRQLENSIERAIVLAQGQLVSVDHLHLAEASADSPRLDSALGQLLDQGGTLEGMLGAVRSRLIRLAMERSRGDREAAARLLGVSPEDLG